MKSSRDWPWSSAGQEALATELRVPLTEPPVPRRSDWREWVDRPQTAAEEQAVQLSIRQSRPYGDANWFQGIKRKFGWREPLPPGRPRKRKK